MSKEAEVDNPMTVDDTSPRADDDESQEPVTTCVLGRCLAPHLDASLTRVPYPMAARRREYSWGASWTFQ